MSSVVITGSKDGFAKISMTKLIRAYTGLGLAPGKRCTDDILDGKPVVFRFTEELAERFVVEAQALGALCHIEMVSTLAVQR